MTPQEAPDILSPAFAADPYPVYRRLRDEAPLLWHAPTRSYLLSRYEDVRRAFKDPAFTSENYAWQLEPVHGRTFVQMSGHEHTVRRALVAPVFRGTSLQEKLLPVIERNAGELIDGFRDTGRVELVSQFAGRFPVHVIVDMMGLDRGDHDTFQRWYRSVVAFLGNLSRDPEVAAEGLRTREEFAAYLLPVIRRRRAALGDDLLSSLCTAEVDGTAMSDEEIRAFCSLLLSAGAETTDKAVAAVMRNLLLHPEQLAAVTADRELIPRAFIETLRHTPPVQMIMRQVAGDVEMSGGVIPDGSTVICLIGSAGRDERRYADPDSFDVFRTDLTARTAFSAAADHLSFALGRHFCVGALLAKAEIEVAIGQLLDAMPDVGLEPGFTPRDQGTFTRGPAALPLRFTPVRGRVGG
ncbi:cytochrome P450 [Streptomyces sp. NEAU-Y11]|uniref:cytochrome P450 n=1 Tax=Streptomyces cucumeris TaxID=2962890 RepID=UPI0020C8AA2A|nr:cytochrome P450 [Streptomyces sp. NEAU-Y11]MCP9210868.1 cytochrome P450 [Streptomyces sp. NEAU-Y11]